MEEGAVTLFVLTIGLGISVVLNAILIIQLSKSKASKRKVIDSMPEVSPMSKLVAVFVENYNESAMLGALNSHEEK